MYKNKQKDEVNRVQLLRAYPPNVHENYRRNWFQTKKQQESTKFPGITRTKKPEEGRSDQLSHLHIPCRKGAKSVKNPNF